jgi:hypothetical protein
LGATARQGRYFCPKSSLISLVNHSVNFYNLTLIPIEELARTATEDSHHAEGVKLFRG